MQEAAAASALNGMQVVDRKIVVEQAAVADRAKEAGDANPYAQIQAHQLQHVMAAQIQQSSLAAQVAAMRVQAKTNPATAVLPGAASVLCCFFHGCLCMNTKGATASCPGGAC